MLSDNHLQSIARRVGSAARSPAKVIVFGSYGRGDAVEFERRREWSSGPVYWAAREGRVLYDGEPAT